MKTMKRLERAVFAICAVVLITGFATPRDKHPGDRYEAPEVQKVTRDLSDTRKAPGR